MEIKTTFNIGDTVYYLKNSEIKKDTIREIRLTINDNQFGSSVIGEEYLLGNIIGGSESYSGKYLFKSLEEMMEVYKNLLNK